jgi:hypothetical protein
MFLQFRYSETHGVAVCVRLGSPKLGLAKMVQVFLARGSVIGIVHTNIPRRFTTRTAFLEVLTITTFKDVHLREVDTWIIVVINGTILRAQVFCTETNVYG